MKFADTELKSLSQPNIILVMDSKQDYRVFDVNIKIYLLIVDTIISAAQLLSVLPTLPNLAKYPGTGL